MIRAARLRHGDRAELVEHLGELRRRVFTALFAVIVATGVAFAFRGHLLDLLNTPLPADHAKPVTFSVTEPFATSLKVSIYAGFALALPLVLWQMWAFVAPAFNESAQRAAAWLVVAATALFGVGLVFAYFVVLPAGVGFLTTFDSDIYDIQVRAADYYSFVSLTLLAVGVVFELPVFILGLVRFGVLSAARLRRNRRIGYTAMAVLAVVLPGVDPITTAVMMGPLFLLFESSVWLAWFFERRWNAAAPLAYDH